MISKLLTFFIVLLSVVEIYSYDDDSSLPIRIKQHPQSQIAQKGSKVIFKCDYETFDQLQSDIKLSWLFNTNIIVQTQYYLIDRNRLILSSYDPFLHNGQYRCMINSTQSNLVIISEPANLTMASIEPFESDNSMIQLNLSEGNVAIIACKLPQSSPLAIPIFYFNDVILPTSSSNSMQDNNRYKVFPSGNLQITNVKYSDSGVYKCSARNPITNEIKINPKKTSLKVYEPFGTKLPEIVYVPIDTNRVQIGANLTLECVANGAPVPLVSWEKFGGILPEKRSFQIFGNLILTNVQPEDKGTYVCRAENGPGQATFKTAMIDVFEAPTLIKTDDFKYTEIVKRGDTVDLKCPIKSRPRADIQWYFQGRQIINSNSLRSSGLVVSNMGDKSILTIRNFQPSQSTGVYQCYAQNEYGYAQANINVASAESAINQQQQQPEVIMPAKRPVIIMGPQNTTIYEGQSVVLLCITGETSTGTTQINWLQNDLIIEPTLMRRFEINQLLGNLRIVSIQKSDAGVYKCIASNEYGMSTAEAYVQVKSGKNSDDDSSLPSAKNLNKQRQEETLLPTPKLPSSSRPIIQQIGVDKILLKWHLVDSNGANLDLAKISNQPQQLNNILYFKVDYKTNKQSNQLAQTGIQPHTWLTIDEQIDPKKREYILTDLSKYESYRFRITAYYSNGDMVHSYQSARFKLDASWSINTLSTSSSSSSTTMSTTTSSQNNEFKLSQVKVQITQIWAISSTSLGLKWKLYLPSSLTTNKTFKITDKINGFYIYYRKVSTSNDQAQSNEQNLVVPSTIPLYNYTRINLPISIIDQSVIDTYIIANLESSSQYEIKMTCYNINGDLCTFSNNMYGLTLFSQTIVQNTKKTAASNNENTQSNIVYQKTKHNEILFMILGIVMGILTLLLIIFIIMCIARHRQHKRLLAQLHNTSQKLTSSSCPTLIYEDSIRNGTHPHHQMRTNLSSHHGQAYGVNSNDSNSTNSQSMSTTTSSMTTPPALISAQTNADLIANCTPSHFLLLNGNTVSLPPVPPLPQNSQATLNRININLNPLASANSALSPNKTSTINNKQQLPSENFYHTLTQLGNLPNMDNSNDNANNPYSDYNNSTINMRAHQYLIKQQQQQQQILINTLKTLNIKQQQLAQLQTQLNNNNNTNNSATATLEKKNSSSSCRSPSTSSMKRNNSVNSSKRSRKSLKTSNNNNNSNLSEQNSNTQLNSLLQLQQQQQQKNYYLLPNVRPAQNIIATQAGTLLNTRNIYNDVDLLTLEAALLNSNLANGNLFLINNPYQSQQPISSAFMPPPPPPPPQSNQIINSPKKMTDPSEQNVPLMSFMNMFENNCNTKEQIDSRDLNKDCLYESSDIIDNNNAEQEPMLTNHYASTGLLVKQPDQQQSKKITSQENCKI